MNVLAPGSDQRKAGGLSSNHLAPAFTLAEARIGILGVCPRLQQRDCLRLTRSSSQHRHVGCSMLGEIPARELLFSISGKDVFGAGGKRVTLDLAKPKVESIHYRKQVN